MWHIATGGKLATRALFKGGKRTIVQAKKQKKQNKKRKKQTSLLA